jgi:hypothetical protein
MNTADAITQPLPAYAREPLLLVIDAQEERLVWVVRLLTFAHYHVHAAPTPLEMLVWYVQHPMSPQAVLLGQVDRHNLFLVQRLLQRIVRRRKKEVPLIFLATYLPDTEVAGVESSLSSSMRGGFALLELLWQLVVRLF